ncbi:MAG: hypothetical protein HY695_00660 [Deltaproteobacteria bacterium]|nr:hypothetical protein [Deltaproteobacteria bacterium]
MSAIPVIVTPPPAVQDGDKNNDLSVGLQAPAGIGQNWIPSVPGKAWFCYFRVYAPTEEHFNRKWTRILRR